MMNAQQIRASRHRAPRESHRGDHLGKSLQHHQVVPATMSSDAGHTANRPHTLERNKLLSSTGGLRASSTHHTHSGIGNTISAPPKDAKSLQSKGVYLHQPAHSRIKGGH
jgi:hypothetical protein